MAAIVYGVTDKGFVRKPLAAVVDSLNSRFTAAFGSTFDVSPESPDGQVIGIIGNEASLLWEQAQQAFNSYRPGAVEGVGLDAVCELTRTKRYVNKPTAVTVECTGSAGSVVPAGLTVGDGTYEFVTKDDVTLPGDVTAYCTTPGAIYVAPNTVTKVISGGTSSLTSVNNTEEGDVGIVYESDPALRVRRDKTTVADGSATVEAIYSALADLNLDYIRIRDNDTGAAIDGQPSGTIYVVVDGGTVNDIAKRIYQNKAGGVPTYGNVEATIKDSKGYPKKIKFSRTSKVKVKVEVTVKRLPGANLSSNDVEVAIQDVLVDYINSLQPGAPVVWSYLIPPVLGAVPGIQVDSLKVGLDGVPVGNYTVPMKIDQRASVEVADIKVTDATVNP